MKAMDNKKKGLIFLCITVILFSTYEVVCKLIGSRLHPLQISFMRFMIGGLILLPFALQRIKKRRIKITAPYIIDIAILGFVNIVISMGFIQYGLLYANASTSAVIFSSNPIFVAIFASIVLREKIEKRMAIGMVTGIIGVAVLFSDRISLKSGTSFGLLLVFLSSVVFALYTVLGKRSTLKGSDSLVMTSFSFIAGSVMLLPAMLILKVPAISMDISLLPYILYLGIMVSGIAYMCYFYGLANINTSTGSLIYFVKPVLAAIISVLILHESLSMYFYAGTAIILAGLAVVNIKLLSPFKYLRR
jgi:drug/metabolite transporter (DMT)-like permease